MPKAASNRRLADLGLEVVSFKADAPAKFSILLGIPVNPTHSVRIEWHHALAGLVLPCNWANTMVAPQGFLVDDAQNFICQVALERNVEYLGLIEDDNLVPPNLFLKWRRYMEENAKDQANGVPVVSGLYHVKGCIPPEPMIYRGRGNGPFLDWKLGDKVWADGVPTGCILIHMSLIRELAKTAPVYTMRANGSDYQLRKIFETPREVIEADGDNPGYQKLVGTSDLWFCDTVIKQKILQKTGWTSVAKRKYPFLVDTSIKVGHIDRETGVIW